MASSRKRLSAEPKANLSGLPAVVARFVDERRLRGRRAAVALSGGVDSVVLLFLLKDLLPVRAVHVHHGLSPNADAWAAFCTALCRKWKVPLAVRRVRVAKAGRGLEAAARKARYEVLESIPSEVVFLAHHLDDQAETVLLQLLRGAGVRGLAAMSIARRPGRAGRGCSGRPGPRAGDRREGKIRRERFLRAARRQMTVRGRESGKRSLLNYPRVT